MNWPTVALSSVADVRLGRQRAPKNHQGDRMRPYVRAANVSWSGLRLDDVKRMNFTDAEMETYQLRRGDLLLNEASGSPGEVGKPALWNDEIAECAFQNTLIRVRPMAHESKFLLHYFRLQALTGEFVKHSRGVGIHHIGRARLADWSVPLPPMEEQSRIVEILEDHLSRLDAAETSTLLARRRTETLLSAARLRAHVGPEIALGKVAEIRGGIQKQPKRIPRHHVHAFLRVANVGRTGLDLDDVHQIELFEGEIERYRLLSGDLLVVEGNGSASQIGRAALWDASIEDCVHQNHLIRVRPGTNLLPEFLETVWNSPRTRQHVSAVASSSSGLHTLSVRKLQMVPVQVPDLSTQRAAVDYVDRLRRGERPMADAIERTDQRALSLRRALLTAAFSGQLTGSDSDLERAEEAIEV